MGSERASQGWSEYTCSHNDFVTPFEQSVAELIRPGSRVLEIGCGCGRFIDLSFKIGAAQVVAIEPRSDQRDELLGWSSAAASANEQGRFAFISDLWPEAYLDLRDQEFDLVFSQSSLHYLEPKRRVEGLTRIRNILKPNGVLALAVRSIDCSWYEQGELKQVEPGRWVYQDQRVRTFFTLDGLVRELRQAGFSVPIRDCNVRIVQDYGHTGDLDIWLEVITRATNAEPGTA